MNSSYSRQNFHTGVLTDLLPKAVNCKLARAGLAEPGRPINITLSVTNKCQSKCKTCNIWQLYNGSDAKDGNTIQDEMSLDEYVRLFRSLGHVYFVNMSGGEPFLRRDFADIVEAANDLLTPTVIHTPTNALMPERIEEVTENILGRLAASGRTVLFTVKPSMDGVGELHDRIRGVPGNFEKLQDTIERLKRLKNRYPNLEVGTGTVISTLNIAKMQEIAEFAYSLSLDSYISEIAEQREELFNIKESITPSTDDYEKAIKQFARTSRKHLTGNGQLGKRTGAFRLVYYDLVVRILREQRQVLPCYAGISNIHISPYGDVWPCCILAYEKSMGRLRDFDYDFWRIWRSDRAKDVRSYIRHGNCWCQLANQAYSNILLSTRAMSKVASIVLKRRKHTPAER